MKIAVAEAASLVDRAMRRVGFSWQEARIIVDQIIGCELRGVSAAGLSRALSIIERVRSGPPAQPIRIVRESPVSALVDGGNTCGYLVAPKAVDIAIAKAKQNGLAAVGAFNTWYSGMYAHYLERATNERLVAMAMGSSAPRVAPHGATEGRFGTNPIAFAFPTTGDPIIFDSGTSGIVIADVILAQRLGQPLPVGVAYAPDGSETNDPATALAGALKAWGGHRGSGLGLVVQLFGILAGGGAMPEDYRDCGFFFMALRPDLFMDAEEFAQRATHYARNVRTARPVKADSPVRLPFQRSAETRRRILAEGAFEAAAEIVAELRRIADAPEKIAPADPGVTG